MSSLEPAIALNLPPNSYIVITAHDEISVDIVCRDTGLTRGAFTTLYDVGYEHMSFNAESNLRIPNALPALAKVMRAWSMDDPAFVKIAQGGETRMPGYEWLDNVKAIRNGGDLGQFISEFPVPAPDTAKADSGLPHDAKDVELVMSRAYVSRPAAVKALNDSNGDVVLAIMLLTM